MWSFCGRRRDCGAPAICILWINDASGDCKDSRCEGKSGYSGPGGNSANGNGRWKSVSRWLWRQPAGESRWSPVIPMQWTVVAIALGGGADGEGARPSPLSHRVAILVTPPRPKGRGQCVAIPGGNRLMGISRNSRFHPGQEGISGFRDTAACGEGASPLPCPHPQGDSHHGPLPG